MKIPLLGARFQPRMIDGDQNFFWIGETRGSGLSEGIYGTPGLNIVASCGSAGMARAAKVVKNILYFVTGNKFYSCDTAWTITELGTLSTSTGVCYIEDNGTQIMVWDGGHGYIYTIATLTFAEISDTDFVYGGGGGFLDGYFIGFDPDTQVFGISNLYDGTAWDALDFASAEGRPDNVLRILTHHREAWMFGVDSTEIYYNSGNATFPIERISGGFIEHGILAPATAIILDNTPFWLSSDTKTGERLFVRASNYAPQIITDDFMAYQLDHMTTVSDAIAYGYIEGGHAFYVVTFPTENKTFCFDLKTQLWHKRASWPDSGRHRANWHVYYNGKHVVGDYNSGDLHEMSMDIYDENGNEIIRKWTFPEVASPENQPIFHHELTVILETGLEATTETEPMIMLDYTENGGKTWSSERQLSAGEVGDYVNLARAKRLGKSRRRAYRISVSSDRKWGLLGMNLRASAGRV